MQRVAPHAHHCRPQPVPRTRRYCLRFSILARPPQNRLSVGARSLHAGGITACTLSVYASQPASRQATQDSILRPEGVSADGTWALRPAPAGQRQLRDAHGPSLHEPSGFGTERIFWTFGTARCWFVSTSDPPRSSGCMRLTQRRLRPRASACRLSPRRGARAGLFDIRVRALADPVPSAVFAP